LLFFSESRILDKPLSFCVASETTILLNFINNTHSFIVKPVITPAEIEGVYHLTESYLITYKDISIIRIMDSCNGLELFVLYVGFIIAMPVGWKRKLTFSILGTAIIYLINVLRCVGLGELSIRWREAFDVAHHFIFNILIYSTIFGLWIVYCKKLDFKKINQ